jgi:Zn-dependent protease with chaperone function
VEIAGLYYDGRTSSSREVRLRFCDHGSVSVLGDDVSYRFPLSKLKIASRIGNAPRSIQLPNGGKCEVANNDLLDQILTLSGEPPEGGWIHKLESSLLYVVVAVLVTAGFAWSAVNHGIPWLAERAAYALPHGIDRKLGQGTLDVLDGALFQPSTLGEDTRRRLTQHFLRMTQHLADGETYRLEFRSGKGAGANAFALPSGIVVITDELVNLSKNDDEVVSVMAHEIGHLEHRHSLRMVMQDSALALVTSAVTGDPFSASTLAVALPTVLVHASYSRDFETQADSYAYSYLLENQIPLEAFANILERLSGERQTSDVARFLSSHPGTQERVKRFKSAPQAAAS